MRPTNNTTTLSVCRRYRLLRHSCKVISHQGPMSNNSATIVRQSAQRILCSDCCVGFHPFMLLCTNKHEI